MANSVDKLARRLFRLEREVRARSMQPQLPYSSIDDGALEVRIDGETTMTVGEQYDGTTAPVVLTGPPPPKPSAPTLTPSIGMLIVSWDGLWAPADDGSLVVAPMDFARVEVHVSNTGPDFEPDLAVTMRGSFESPRGGSFPVTVPYEEPQWVKLVARSLAGKGSEPSDWATGAGEKIVSVDIADLAITEDNIADFALAVTKFRTLQHQIY